MSGAMTAQRQRMARYLVSTGPRARRGGSEEVGTDGEVQRKGNSGDTTLETRLQGVGRLNNVIWSRELNGR